MSGYDSSTGWCHFTPTKVNRYYRQINGKPDDIQERFVKANIPFYYDRSGGIHGQCCDGQMWTILSGRPSTWSSKESDDGKEQEYLVISDIAANLTPKTSPTKVNRLLESMGYQTKTAKGWKVTSQGKKLSKEFESSTSYSKSDAKTFLKWQFAMIQTVQQKLLEAQ